VISKVAEKITAQDVKCEDQKTEEGSTNPTKYTEGGTSETSKKDVTPSISEDEVKNANDETSRKSPNEKLVKARPGRLGARRVREAGVAKRLTAADKRKKQQQKDAPPEPSGDSYSELENKRPKLMPKQKTGDGNKKRRLSEETVEEDDDNVPVLRKDAGGSDTLNKEKHKEGQTMPSPKKVVADSEREKEKEKLSHESRSSNGGSAKSDKDHSRKPTEPTTGTKRKHAAGDDRPTPLKKIDREIAVSRVCIHTHDFQYKHDTNNIS
jgi:hypothetical protein